MKRNSSLWELKFRRYSSLHTEISGDRHVGHSQVMSPSGKKQILAVSGKYDPMQEYYPNYPQPHYRPEFHWPFKIKNQT